MEMAVGALGDLKCWFSSLLGGDVGFDLERHVNQYRIHKNNIWGFCSLFILDSV